MKDSNFIKINYLIEMGCSNTPHSGTTLLEHLIGVYNILKESGAQEYVCDAGLFHSIYGTISFRHKTTEDRDRIRELIGNESENLVYTFSTLQRPRSFFIGELKDCRLREDLILLNNANQLEMNKRPAPEMDLDEAYGNLWNYNGS
jgi:hypothetical protein|tara:strand:+ start:1096 stop:1533 length:438 start_codon:yes stop_codon:yes gene_type:complete